MLACERACVRLCVRASVCVCACIRVSASTRMRVRACVRVIMVGGLVRTRACMRVQLCVRPVPTDQGTAVTLFITLHGCDAIYRSARPFGLRRYDVAIHHGLPTDVPAEVSGRAGVYLHAGGWVGGWFVCTCVCFVRTYVRCAWLHARACRCCRYRRSSAVPTQTTVRSCSRPPHSQSAHTRTHVNARTPFSRQPASQCRERRVRIEQCTRRIGSHPRVYGPWHL